MGQRLAAASISPRSSLKKWYLGPPWTYWTRILSSKISGGFVCARKLEKHWSDDIKISAIMHNAWGKISSGYENEIKRQKSCLCFVSSKWWTWSVILAIHKEISPIITVLIVIKAACQDLQFFPYSRHLERLHLLSSWSLDRLGFALANE
jgi:hypothetical protein